jgi:dimethylargininase
VESAERIALTRDVSPDLARCELTHLRREPIDAARAAEQHRRYETCLVELGCTLHRLPGAPHLPDAVFVEDTAVVLPEIAVVTRPGAASRRPETESVRVFLGAYRALAVVQLPGMLEGGDVLRLGQRLYVGLTGRTDAEGVRQLAELVAPFGYTVFPIEVSGCLHLKTAVTEVAEGTVLLNPNWIDAGAFRDYERIAVHPEELFAANALRLGDAVIHGAAHRRTADRLRQRGIRVHPIDISELEKAEAGVTCCSIVYSREPPSRP